MRLSTKLYEFEADGKTLIFDGESIRFYIKPGRADPLWVPTAAGVDQNSLIQQEPSLRTISLNLTNRCNMACSYCYANQGTYDKPDATMSLETAVRAIKLIYESTQKYMGNENLITISFFGGEPSLEFDLIRQIVEYVDLTIPKSLFVRYLISTNGSGISTDELSFLSDHNFLVTLSIDGDKSTHNAGRSYCNGQGSYSDVVSTFKKLSGVVPVRARITASSINPNIHENVMHIRELGFESLTFAPDLDMDDESFKTFLRSVENVSVFYTNEIRAGKYFNITNMTDIMTLAVLGRKKISQCKAGLSYLSVSADGRLYRCPRFTGNEDLCLGDLSNVTLDDIEGSICSLRESLKKNVAERVAECSDCPFIYLCGGICYHEAHKRVVHDIGFDKRECNYRKVTIASALRILCDLPEDKRQGLFGYLDDLWRKETGVSRIKEFDLGLSSKDLDAISVSFTPAICEGGPEGASG